MSVNLSTDYLQALETIGTLQASTAQTSTTVQEQQETSSDKDSYITSITTGDEAIPSDMYSNIMELIKENKIAAGEEASAPTDEEFATVLEQLEADSEETSDTSLVAETSTSGASATNDVSDSSSSSGSEGSSSSDDSETTTEFVRGQDGSMYEKTTVTSSDGTETVTMTKIADAPQNPHELQMSVGEMAAAQSVVETETEA